MSREKYISLDYGIQLLLKSNQRMVYSTSASLFIYLWCSKEIYKKEKYYEDSYYRDYFPVEAAQAATLTHGHPLGYLPAAGLAHIVNKVCYDPKITVMEAVADMIDTVYENFRNDSLKYATDFKQLM